MRPNKSLKRTAMHRVPRAKRRRAAVQLRRIKTHSSDGLALLGQSLLYEYDFGDGWEHEVTLEQVLTGVGDRSLPFCIDGQRACPPEDVGGPHGFEKFLRVNLDAHHPDHEQMVDLAGEAFDPERFEVELVNSMLSAI